MVPRAVAFTIVWPEGVIFGSIMTYHVQILLLVRQPLFDRAALPLTQTGDVLRFLSKKNDVWFPKLKTRPRPVPKLGPFEIGHKSEA